MQWGTGEPCLNAAFKIMKIKGGTVVLVGTVAPCQLSGRGNWIFTVLGVFGVFGVFLVFLYFGFWDVFGCDVGHFKALALIPIDVYMGG